MDVEMDSKDGGAGEKKMVDIFSHFSRLISDGQTDKYLEAFEQNNLLANLGNNASPSNGRRYLPPMTGHVTSLPLTESPGILHNDLDTAFNGHVKSDQNGIVYWMDTGLSTQMHYLNGPKCDLSGKPNSQPDEPKPLLPPKLKSYPSRPPMLPPCRVCGDAASGFHYGVNTCEACKGFFRRSIIKSTPHVCVSSGNCKMVLGRRTSCSACRFKRCLEVGMSKHAIKTGRYTHELRSKNILEVKRLQNQHREDTEIHRKVKLEEVANPGPSHVISDVTQCHIEMTKAVPDEYGPVLDQLMEGQTCLYEFLDDYYNEELMLRRQNAVYERYLHDKKRREYFEKLKANYKNGYESLHSSSSQTKDTPEALDHNQSNGKPGNNDCNNATENADNFSGDKNDGTGVNFTEGENNDTSLDSDSLSEMYSVSDLENLRDPTEELKAEVLARFMEDMKRGVKGMLAFAKKIPGFDDLHSEDQVTLVQASRFDIWFLGHIRCFNSELKVGACEWKFHAEELSKVWGERLVEMTFNLSKIGRTLYLNKEETAVLRAFAVSFTDRCCTLQDRPAVEQIHENMLNLLKHIVHKRHNNFNLWFARVIRFFSFMREVADHYVQGSSNLKMEWSVLKDNPTLLEVFLS